MGEEEVNLSEIQHAIEGLPPEEQQALAAWMAERDRTQWDAELERDFAPGGAGTELLERVKRDVREGRSRPFSDAE